MWYLILQVVPVLKAGLKSILCKALIRCEIQDPLILGRLVANSYSHTLLVVGQAMVQIKSARRFR